MSLLERFADPGLIGAMSFGEKMLASVYVAMLGMGITFLALVLLWAAIAAMSRILASAEKRKAAPAVMVAPQAAAVPQAEPAQDESELVAVIAAAIAAATGRDIERIVVRDIRRVGEGQPIWRQAGIQRQVSKRM